MITQKKKNKMEYIVKAGYYFCAFLTLVIAIIFSPIIVFLIGLDVLFDTRILPWFTNSDKQDLTDKIIKCVQDISKALDDLEEEETEHIIEYINNKLKTISKLACGIDCNETEKK